MKRTLYSFQQSLKGKVCRWCKEKTPSKDVPLYPLTINFYSHPYGYDVLGFQDKQWLYVECPECNYQWSLTKLL